MKPSHVIELGRGEVQSFLVEMGASLVDPEVYSAIIFIASFTAGIKGGRVHKNHAENDDTITE